jgi:hypothetical protein
VADASDLEQEFQSLSVELRKLEGEYTMYFAGRTPRPPIESRNRVDQMFKRMDRRPIDTAAMRFRVQTLQSRYSSFADLWDRALRAREEGRPSPLFRTRELRPTAAAPTSSVAPATHAQAEPEPEVGAGAEPEPEAAAPARPSAVTFTDPREESDKLQTLYDALMDARRQAGESNVPFHKFADLVQEQTRRLKKKGLDEVTFSVTTMDGRVNLTAKGSKPAN